MKTKLKLSVLIALLVSLAALMVSEWAWSAEVSVPEAEEAIAFKDVVLEIPASSLRMFQRSFSRDALPYWGVVLGSTGVLYHYDEKISHGARQQAQAWHIGHHYHSKPILKLGGAKLIDLPTDTGSILYYIGDGAIHLALAGGLVAYGKITDRTYEANSGFMLLHGLAMTGLYDQVLKRSFGRESPVEKTQDRGAWHPFPTFHQYQSNTAKYDAMPSGHIMTATLTFTVLGERYQEHRVAIYSVGGVWLAGLGFQMLNNGVHWASDYPLGIAMGVVIGKAVTQMKQRPVKTSSVESWDWQVYPSLQNGAPKLNAVAEF